MNDQTPAKPGQELFTTKRIPTAEDRAVFRMRIVAALIFGVITAFIAYETALERDSVFLFVCGSLAYAGFGVICLWYFRRPKRLIRNWVARNGYTLLEAERRGIGDQGPFLDPNKGQTVYYLTLRDQYGRTGYAFVRVGGRLVGSFSSHVEVIWD